MASVQRRAFLKMSAAMCAAAAGAPVLGKRSFAQASGAPEYRNYMPDKMTYRRLGKTNMMVSTVAFGGANNWHTDTGGAIADDQYPLILQELVNNGVNYFDTSTDVGDSVKTYNSEPTTQRCRPLLFQGTKYLSRQKQTPIVRE
jgi:hypothetical protein